MLPTTAFPKLDPARPNPPAPVAARGRADDPLAADGPPTLRVSIRPASDHDPLAVTPPPTADLRFPISDWSSDGDEDAPPARRGPRVGDTVLGFKLVGELGRGAFARVYLAHQAALADRPVALKVTFRPTREAERLAKLQHTNVVPVYSVHQDGAAQIICMPYLGRTTVADLIRAYRVDLPSRTSGRKSTSARAGRSTALDSGKWRSAPKSAPGSDGHTDRAPVWTWGDGGPPPVVGDPLAVLEMLGQMAAGLSHAHGRGILHLDLKPANVLYAETGEPMLFDFNLSFDATRPDRDLVGGTMPYMAIEQLLDMRDRGSGVIDGRADLFALGVMAFEMLTGAVPFPHGPGARDIDAMVAARYAGPPPLRPLNPLVTPAVEAIVRKLLAAEPEDRYRTADELRTDIARHLADQPLLFTREPSVRERFGKWRRRNPRLAFKILTAGVIGLALGLGVVSHQRSQEGARGAAVEQARTARAAIDNTRLDLILPDDPKARERGVTRATAILAGYGLPADGDWRTRQTVRMLPAAERAALAEDLGELLFLVARAKWQAGATGADEGRRGAAVEAWKLNELARACFADAVPPAVNRQAASLAPIAGETFDPPAAGAPSADPRHLFLDAVDALGNGYYAAAVPQLDKAVSAQPGHAAAQFALAYCRQHLGQHARAIERYDVARALLPTDPRPAHYRGLIYGLTKRPAQAEAEFGAALELAPDSTEAYRNRALARYRIGTKEKLAEAEADLTTALDKGASPLFVYAVREQVRKARGDEKAAAADRADAARIAPQTEQDYFVRGWSRMKTDPKGALADLQKASEINPRSLVALQNQAHVLADGLKDPEAALAVATRAAGLYPEYAPALTGRAVMLARLDKRDEAHKEIAKARLLSEDAEVLFHAACVYSLTSAKNEGDRAEALALLRRALRDGYSDFRGLASDPDLDPIRSTKEFKEIEQSARVLLR